MYENTLKPDKPHPKNPPKKGRGTQGKAQGRHRPTIGISKGATGVSASVIFKDTPRKFLVKLLKGVRNVDHADRGGVYAVRRLEVKV